MSLYVYSTSDTIFLKSKVAILFSKSFFIIKELVLIILVRPNEFLDLYINLLIYLEKRSMNKPEEDDDEVEELKIKGINS